MQYMLVRYCSVPPQHIRLKCCLLLLAMDCTPAETADRDLHPLLLAADSSNLAAAYC
jgi:hypothetical protein